MRTDNNVRSIRTFRTRVTEPTVYGLAASIAVIHVLVSSSTISAAQVASILLPAAWLGIMAACGWTPLAQVRALLARFGAAAAGASSDGPDTGGAGAILLPFSRTTRVSSQRRNGSDTGDRYDERRDRAA